ncbi:dipeptidase PepE [Ascidiimonas aurantiaca]|uniref:dipeptidase PepE n=1 Tax=Ascidiimonas aurantiaca TaxID=1685432 RepID=UPI0030ED75B4
MKKIILASTSTLYKENYLAYLMNPLEVFFKDVQEILFIPYARPSGITHDKYTEVVNTAFAKINKKVTGIHQSPDPVMAIKNAKAVFTGGGNTFVLTSALYREGLMEVLRNKVLSGMPYLGTSAGSNIGGLTMQTTNDMPIMYPPSFKTMGLVPFNINAHYLDPDPKSRHNGETRETRIKEFHEFNTPPVIGLREGSWLEIQGKEIILRGILHARIFEKGKAPYEQSPGTHIRVK